MKTYAQQGFLLVELMLAFLVLGLGTAAVAYAMCLAQGKNTSIKLQSQNLGWLCQQLDNFLRDNADGQMSNNECQIRIKKSQPPQATLIQTCCVLTLPEIELITAQATWKDAQGIDKSLRIEQIRPST